MAVAVITANLFMNIGSGFLLYDYFMMLLEGIIVFTSVYMFSSAKSTLLMAKNDDGVVGNNIISVAMLLGVTVLGCDGWLKTGIFSLSGILCVLSSLIFSHGGGVLTGSAAGIVIGLIAGLSDGNSSSILGAFAFSSMVSGFFSRYGKTATVISFILANSIITFYTNDSSEILINIYEILIAAAIFFVLPKKIFSALEAKEGNRRDYTSKVKGLIEDELAAASDAFCDLSETFKQISEEKSILCGSATASLFERTARKTCDGCGLIGHCWKKEFHRTYTSFFVMLELCEKKGKLTENDIPEILRNKCRRAAKLANSFNSTYEVYRVDKLWESRVSEGRAMIAKHFDCISKRINKMAKDMKKGAIFDYDAENSIAAALSECKLFTKDVTVINRQKNGVNVYIKFKDDVELHKEKICEVVSKIIGEEMMIVFEQGKTIRLESSARYSVVVGAASIPKEQSTSSGDCFGHMNLENGGFMLAMSDGMGSGSRASGDSRATISIIKKLLGAGFDADTSIGLVNSVLVLKSAETRFATVDLALLDLKKSEAQFFKVGAAASYLKRNDEVCKIENKTLPAGVLKTAEIECKKIQICHGDMLVLMSDGVSDADRAEGDSKWISDMLADYKGTNPEELANRILEGAKRKSCGMICDDMSVMVARITKIGA